VDGREPLPVESLLGLAGLRAESDTVREPRLGIGTDADSIGLRITQIGSGAAAAAGARVGDRIVSLGDVAITNDESFETFRAHYSGTTLATLPFVVRRGAETLTLQLPVRLSTRPRTRVLPLSGASAKAIRIRHGILTGSPAPTGSNP
jgi:predicted metalloprotease with PDZ domain